MTRIQRIDYDAENDILYVAFTEQHNSYGDEVSDHIVIRRDWDTESITGVTIFDFMALYEAHLPEIQNLPVELDLEKQVLPFLKTAIV